MSTYDFTDTIQKFRNNDGDKTFEDMTENSSGLDKKKSPHFLKSVFKAPNGKK